MLAHKVVGKVVEQTCLLVATCTLAPYVVEEYSERADAQVVHQFQFLSHVDGVLQAPLDIACGVDGPYELNLVLVCCVNEFLQFGSLVGWIGLAPACAVVGIVLRTEHIGIHLVLAIEIELAQAVLVAPGVAIETLDDTTVGYAGIVGNLACHNLILAHDLRKGLCGIVCTAVVATGNYNLLGTDLQVVAFGLGRDEFLELLYGLVVCFTDDDGSCLGELLCIHLLAGTNDVQLRGKQFNGIGICLRCAYKIELLRLGKGLVAPADLLGQRRDCYSLAVGCNGCHTCQKGCKQFLHKDNIDGYLIESDHYCVQRYEINRNNAQQWGIKCTKTDNT